MRVLVTGATGFVGRRLCEVLSGSGCRVTALSRRPDAARQTVPSLSQVYAWRPVEEAPPLESLQQVDAVIHLAGESVVGRWNARKRRAIRESRVRSTRNLVDAMRQAKARPRSLISASAIGYYGDQGETELTESMPAADDFLGEACGQWEREGARASEAGVRVVHLRIGIVLAAGGGALDAMLLPARLGLGGPLGSGRQWWSWIHREDLIGMVQHVLAGENLSGPFNATSSNPVRQKDFAKVLGRVLSRPAFLPTPGIALKLVLGGFAIELLSSKKVLPDRIQESGYRFLFPDLEPALREIVG
jgi:uncharacterized protein (TIGR01777 family)